MNCQATVLVCLIGSALAAVTGCSTVTSQSSKASSSGSSATVAAAARAASSHTDGAKWELSAPDQPSVDYWVRQFSERKHQSFQTQLDRASMYVVPAQEVFQGYGLPKDLIYVALIESGFMPKARSHAKAVGMWQFIPETGRRFGLEQNRYIDERCHPMKSARAAAEYLSFLYDTFGSWPLALAGYNAGEKAVQRALDQSGATTFWELEAAGYLPSETRDYVPKVLAAVKVIRNHAHYGFRFHPDRLPPKHHTVSIPGGVKLAWVGKQIGVSEQSLQSCNPELCKPVTPPGCTSYELCLPEGNDGSVLGSLIERALQEQPPKSDMDEDESGPAVSSRIKLAALEVGKANQSKGMSKNTRSPKGVAASRSPKDREATRALAKNDGTGERSLRKKGDRNEPAGLRAGDNKSLNAGRKGSGTATSAARKGEQSPAAEKSRAIAKLQRAQGELKPPPKSAAGSQVKIASNQRSADASPKKTTRR